MNKIKAPTQMDAIKKAFASGLKLSCLNAFQLTGTMNLVQRVADLKHDKWVIESKTETTKTRFGTDCKYSIYWLNKTLTNEQIWKPFEAISESGNFVDMNHQIKIML